MEARTYTDPAEFLAAADPLLAQNEARHNLVYGIAGAHAEDPGEDELRMWIVEERGAPVAAALRTMPRRVILTDAAGEDAASLLAGVLATYGGDELPGAVGNVPSVEWFVAEWQRRTGSEIRLSMAQGIFALDRVQPVPVAPGTYRPATVGDRELLAAWHEEFSAEAFPDDPEDPGGLLRWIDDRLAGRSGGGLWLWERDGRPVAMSGNGGRTPHGIRIGPVYTPPEERGRGYATSLVAAQSRWLLEQGRRFCFLYTDLANPTSNAIYERIGFRRVADSAQYTFVPG